MRYTNLWLIKKLQKPHRFKRAKSFLFNQLQFHYEYVIAPWIAKYLWWLFWPLYFACKKTNIYFVVNITSTMGHIVVELDHFFRIKFLQNDPKKRYIWIKKKDPFSPICVELYRKKFWWAISNTLLYNLTLPLTMKFKAITLDAGISRLKWQLPKLRKYHERSEGSHLYQISKSEGLVTTARYYQMIQKSPSFFPLSDFSLDLSALKALFPNGFDQLVLIQIKDVVRNATAKKPNPEDYFKTLWFLKDEGYQLVFVGREKMPQIFQKLEVINYAESPFASFHNDIQLFKIAEFILLTGCGVSVLADVLDKYYLYLNSWQLSVSPYSAKSIFVPAHVKSKYGQHLSFLEQNALYKSLVDIGPELFPHGEYDVFNASEEEIYMATQELIELKNSKEIPLSPLQKQFRELDIKAPMYYTQSRCSQFFLQQHANLLKSSVNERV